MARYNLGGGAADFAFSVTSGNLLRLAPATLYVWEDETGDTRVTDLLLNGVAASVIPVASDGQIPTFQGPDGVASLWVSAGENGTRVLLAAPGQPGPEGPPGPPGEPGGADDADVALAVTSGTETKAALSAAIVSRSPATGFVMEQTSETTTTAAAIPTGSLAGVAYGRKADGSGGLYKSTDNGETWTLVTGSVTPYGGIHALGDGEVLVNQGTTLRRSTGWATNPSTATWATVATANGTSQFIDSNVDTYDNIVIAAEYAVPRNDARYVKVSTDYGATFTNVRDLSAMHPGVEGETHWHAVAIDPWHDGANPRLWISHGDGPRGVYYSDDLGANWTLYDNAWQPMPLMATVHGIVTSTDQPNPDGVWLIPRDLSPKVNLARIHRPFWNGSLLGFGISAARDETTGIVYILFRADQQTYFTESNKAVIFATDGQRASIIYETQQGATVGVSGSTNWEGRPALTADGHLLATYNVGTSTKRIVSGRVRRGTKAAAVADKGNVLTGGAKDRTSIAIGYGTNARNRTVAIGTLAGAAMLDTDANAVLVGEEVTGANQSVAIGFQAKTTANHGVAIGNVADVGSESVAIGSQAAATGKTLAVAVGRLASVTVDGGTAVGKSATVSGNNGVAIGNAAQALSTNGAAFGYDARVNAASDGALALGVSTRATGTNSVAIGKDTSVNGSHALGIGPRHIEVGKFTAAPEPGNPTADKARLFVKDNGAGKMQLCVRFPTGASVALATEA